jgi:putative oxidoreductase
MAISRLIARPMLASMFVMGGINSLQNSEALAARAKPVADRIKLLTEKYLPIDPPGEKTLVRLNGGLHVAAGLGLATGRAPRTSALLLAATLIPTTFGGHRFWEEGDPAARANQRIHFFKNISMMGGLLIAAGDTAGKPGLAWRARHAATDVRREAGHQLREVRLQTKALAS